MNTLHYILYSVKSERGKKKKEQERDTANYQIRGYREKDKRWREMGGGEGETERYSWAEASGDVNVCLQMLREPSSGDIVWLKQTRMQAQTHTRTQRERERERER